MAVQRVRPSGEMRTRAILRLIFIAFKVDAELFAPVTSQAPQFNGKRKISDESSSPIDTSSFALDRPRDVSISSQLM